MFCVSRSSAEQRIALRTWSVSGRICTRGESYQLLHAFDFLTDLECFCFRVLYQSKVEAGLERLTYDLSLSCIHNNHALRTRAIRTFYILKQPFTSWINPKRPFSDNLDVLVNHQCHFTWFKQTEKNLWNIFFKFKHVSTSTCSFVVKKNFGRNRKRDLLEEEDIHYNPDDGCRVLCVVSEHFAPVSSSVMGQFLLSSSLSVGHNMRYHKLKMRLAVTQGDHKGGGHVVVIDSVLNAQVFPWWHPAYPGHGFS